MISTTLICILVALLVLGAEAVALVYVLRRW